MSRLSWEEYFSAMVSLTSLRSEDPNTKVGSIIVNQKNRIIALGYNGMVDGNDSFPWARKADKIEDTKYPYVIHAEVNAILNATTSVDGATLYVSLFPCSNCAKLISQSGIKKVVYQDDKYHDTEDAKISRRIFKAVGVETKKVKKIEIKVI